MRLHVLVLLCLALAAAAVAAPHPDNDYDAIRERRPLRAAMPKGAADPAAAETLHWNALVLDAIRVNRTFPPTATRALAMIHAAMFEAANSIVPRWEPYLAPIPAQPGASVSAAIAAAAHGVARVQFPAQALDWDAALDDALNRVADPQARDRGRIVGEDAAQAMLAARNGDGSAATISYTPGSAPGDWRPTRPDFTPALAPHWGGVRPFAIADAADHLAPPPHPLDSAAYADDYNEVKAMGEVFLHARTEEQTRIAYFWSDPAGSASPPGHWNLIAADFVARTGMDEPAAAHVLALLNLALADAAIVCWGNKYRDNFWRPITAINLGDSDGNDATAGDPLWTPLLATPRFPDHTSGHSTFSGAAAVILGAVFGPQTPFEASSDMLLANYGIPDFVRTFDSFEEAAKEASLSRLYGGIHFRRANESGLESGRSIAAEVLESALLPLPSDIWILR